MLSCKEVSQLVSESVDRDLSFGERVGVGFHLWICHKCRKFVHNMTLIKNEFRQLIAEPENLCAPHIELSAAAGERIRQKLLQCQCAHPHRV